MYQKSSPDVKREGRKNTHAQDVGTDPKPGLRGSDKDNQVGISVEPSPTQNVAVVINSTALRGHSYPF